MRVCLVVVPELELPAPRNVTYAHLECLRISAGRGRRVPNGHVTGGRRRTRNLINEAASGIASGTSRPGPGLASRNVTFRVATGVDSARPGATKAPSRRLVASRSRALLVLEQSTGTSRGGAVRARATTPPGSRWGKISLLAFVRVSISYIFGAAAYRVAAWTHIKNCGQRSNRLPPFCRRSFFMPSKSTTQFIAQKTHSFMVRRPRCKSQGQPFFGVRDASRSSISRRTVLNARS